MKTAYYEIYFIDRALAGMEANEALVAEPALYSLWREWQLREVWAREPGAAGAAVTPAPGSQWSRFARSPDRRSQP